MVRGALPAPWGGVLVLGIFLSVWANDSFAYLIGRKFGKHKLAPRTSPKKSWEGSVSYTHLDVYKRQPVSLGPRVEKARCASACLSVMPPEKQSNA